MESNSFSRSCPSHSSQSMKPSTDAVIRFIRKTTFEGLPPEVRHQSKRCLLDGLGAALAGTQTPVSRVMARFAFSQMTGDEATVLATGGRASAVGAALANGFAGNAFDIDDGYRRVKGHPGACVLPAILAASELAAPVSGKAFLTALVVGYELGIRAGMIRHALYPVYHASGSWGAMAGAGAAGRLLGLSADALRHAIGAAEYHAPIAPMMKGIAAPSMVKDGIGWGAMVAVASARLAADGFTGIDPLFDEAPEPDWILGLGTDYEILNLYFKPYAACRWAQPAVDGALLVMRQHGLAPAEIARIEVATFSAAAALSRTPPSDTEAAQYNMAFPIAAALIDGAVGPRQVLPPRLFDPDLREMMARVTVSLSPAFEAAFPEKTYAEVTLETVDGRRLNSGRMEARWEPPDTLPDDDALMEKFRELVGPVRGERTAAELIDRIFNLDLAADVDGLIAACLPRMAD